MIIKSLIVIVISFCIANSANQNLPAAIDTSRFVLDFSNDSYWVLDNWEMDSIKFELLLPGSEEELEDEKAYISSSNYSAKTNSFEIGNGLIAIHVVSYDFMKEGSAQAGAGRDVFLTYDPAKKIVLNKILDFGITKKRYRYMGCLFAQTSHFILADIDNNGLIDIGRIKEELKCDDSYQTYFVQDSVEWYVYSDKHWDSGPAKILTDGYVELPLINIKMNPIDVFGFNKWQSFDPKDWAGKSKITHYPEYRLDLIQTQNSN